MENPYTRRANLLVSNIIYQKHYYRGAWSKHKGWWLSFRSSATALMASDLQGQPLHDLGLLLVSEPKRSGRPIEIKRLKSVSAMEN